MEYEKSQRIYKTVMLVILVAVITFIVTMSFMYNKSGTEIKYVMVNGNKEGTTGIGAELNKMQDVVDKYYLGEYDENKMKDEAIKGYIAGLDDEYSEYIPADEYEKFMNDISGSFVGIGIYFGKTKDNEMIIVAPISESVAEKAGIEAGDIITKVDDLIVTEETTTEEVSSKIKGEVGTVVKIEVLRENKIINFEIKRENVKLHYVKSSVIEENIGVLKFVSFDENTSEDFKSKLNDLLEQNIKSLIIDLRNNGGGIMEEATKIADYLLKKNQIIIITRDKNGEEEVTYSKQEPITDIPIVVLVNANTASAAEILTTALKENNRAKVVGIKTYGKGVIQRVYRLSDGSAVKLTTNEYYTPIGNKINRVGIKPDESVEVPDGVNVYNIPSEKDTQLQKAIEMLKEY